MHFDAKITSKGQITLPVELRRRLGVDHGHTVRFEIDADGRVRVYKVSRSLEDLRGIVKTDRRIAGDDINRWIAERRGRAHDDALS